MVSVGRDFMKITYYNLVLVNSGTIWEDGLCVSWVYSETTKASGKESEEST